MKNINKILIVLVLLISSNLVFACDTQQQIDRKNNSYNSELSDIKNGNFEITDSEQAQINLIIDKYSKLDKAKSDLDFYKKVQQNINGINETAPSVQDYINSYILKGTKYYIADETIMVRGSSNVHFIADVNKNYALYKQEVINNINNAQNIIDNIGNGDMETDIYNLRQSFIPYHISQLHPPIIDKCPEPTLIKKEIVPVDTKIVDTKVSDVVKLKQDIPNKKIEIKSVTPTPQIIEPKLQETPIVQPKISFLKKILLKLLNLFK